MVMQRGRVWRREWEKIESGGGGVEMAVKRK